MGRFSRLIILTFIESFATILVERGIYFYGHDRLYFSDTANLWMALGIGLFYVIGALVSHQLAGQWGEKKLLATLLVGHFLAHVSLACFPYLLPFLAVNMFLAFCTGAKWPLIESYISAGRNARETARALGKFNITWSLSVPLAMAAIGPLIHVRAWALFILAAVINLGGLWVLRPLESRPVHLAPDDPERLSGSNLQRYVRLQWTGRLAMFGSYSLLFLLVPLMPRIFEDLGYQIAAPALGSLVEVVRASTFLFLFLYAGWHGRVSYMIWAVLALPIGFATVLLGKHLPVVLAGEIVFGVAAGVAYYGALYYGMVVANASVKSGGAHESLVGGGFAFGPMLGLIGMMFAQRLGGANRGMLAVVGPVTLVGMIMSLWPWRPWAKRTIVDVVPTIQQPPV